MKLIDWHVPSSRRFEHTGKAIAKVITSIKIPGIKYTSCICSSVEALISELNVSIDRIIVVDEETFKENEKALNSTGREIFVIPLNPTESDIKGLREKVELFVRSPVA